jgi:hypothetical protein
LGTLLYLRLTWLYRNTPNSANPVPVESSIDSDGRLM